jgi:predicted DNA-binding protein (MmcQ/YjbR family)
MDVEKFRDYCLSKAYTEEGMPFGEGTLVFKVGGKIFALLSLDTVPGRANLKATPEDVVQLREQYEAVQPGYHMNKVHWNTIYFESDMDDKELFRLVDISYDLIYDSLPKKVKESLL